MQIETVLCLSFPSLCLLLFLASVLSISVYPYPYPRAVLYLVAQSCLTLCVPTNGSPPGSSVHGDSVGKNTGVGCHALLQEFFQTQGLNPGLLYRRWTLLLPSHWGRPIEKRGEGKSGLLGNTLLIRPTLFVCNTAAAAAAAKSLQ